MHRNRNPCNSFLMVKMASGMDHGYVRPTTTMTKTTTNDDVCSRPQRARSFWPAPTIATSGQAKGPSKLEWLCKYNKLIPEPIRFDSEHAQSDGKSVNRGLSVIDLTRGPQRSKCRVRVRMFKACARDRARVGMGCPFPYEQTSAKMAADLNFAVFVFISCEKKIFFFSTINCARNIYNLYSFESSMK